MKTIQLLILLLAITCFSCFHKSITSRKYPDTMYYYVTHMKDNYIVYITNISLDDKTWKVYSQNADTAFVYMQTK